MTVLELLKKYGFGVSASGGGCQWATRSLPGGGFVAITDAVEAIDLPTEIDAPILVGLYDTGHDEEKCATWPWGLECYLSTHFDPEG